MRFVDTVISFRGKLWTYVIESSQQAEQKALSLGSYLIYLKAVTVVTDYVSVLHFVPLVWDACWNLHWSRHLRRGLILASPNLRNCHFQM